jgi:C4-dicarboxylate-specific signal transduction histidine kinase
MGPDLIASILVLIGAGFMVFSIRLGRSLQRVVPNKLKKRWQILILLKLFFLAGYLLFVSILFSSYNLPLELVTGIIFLGGAFFVFIVINLSKDTIRNIKEEKKEISEINSALELKVMEQTAELSNKNEQLMKYNASLEKTQQELKDAYDELKSAQSQMLQKEKMASIGQLAAGVAHEINNPMGFISSNVNSLGRYTKKLTEFINIQDEAIASAELPELSKELNEKRKKLKLDFILEDIDQLIEESLDGADRVKKIVQNL